MENHKIIPEIRFPEFKGEWNRITLKDILRTDIEKNKDGKYSDVDMLSISSSAGVVNQIEYQGRSFAGVSVLPYNVFKKHQVVYTKSPLKEYPYGIIKYNNYKTGIVSTLYAVYSINSGFLGEFIDYYFQLPERINKYLKPLVNIGAKNDMKVNNDKVLRDKIIFPTSYEQKKLVSFFTAIDEKISQLKLKKNLLEQYKKGVMQKIFCQEISFKDDNGKEFPKWERLYGNDIFETVSNKNHNSDLPILAITQEHGAIPRDLIDYYITVTQQSIESYKVVEKGDFIISLRSFQGGIEYSDYKGICSPAYIILRATKKIDNRYFKYYFKTETYITDLNRKLEGIRDGKMISYKYFSDILINVPSLQEQTKIANFFTAIDEKINHTLKQIEKGEIWKKGLLQQMFC